MELLIDGNNWELKIWNIFLKIIIPMLILQLIILQYYNKENELNLIDFIYLIKKYIAKMYKNNDVDDRNSYNVI